VCVVPRAAAAQTPSKTSRVGILASSAESNFGPSANLIVQLAAQHKLPAIYEMRLFPEAGGLLSYGPLPQERFQRMAAYVDRILRGAKPGDLPIERPATFELVINLKASQPLGLTIPQSVLVRADEIIR
jgi:putative ABC transport system substrate-binding protein